MMPHGVHGRIDRNGETLCSFSNLIHSIGLSKLVLLFQGLFIVFAFSIVTVAPLSLMPLWRDLNRAH